MSNQEVILEYRGTVTIDTINPLLDKLKAQSDFKKLDRGIQKKLYSVFVECIENIYKYAANDLDHINNKKPYICLGKRDDQYIVCTGNIILNKSLVRLRSRLDQINRQDHKGLIASYAEIIDQDVISNEEGAGLGLIIIALRSRKRINYTFTSIDQHHSYFEMKILIENGSRGDGGEREKGRRGEGEKGRMGGGEKGRKGGGEKGRRGERERWREGEMERGRDGERGKGTNPGL